jgi:hypothetical protein
MFVGAVITILCIPELQDEKNKSLELEALAKGREGQIVPFLPRKYNDENIDARLLTRIWVCVRWNR